ncbi:hypothetical protein PN36_08900 [Candidatus Thiomargarita nelsonii]|uniref:Secreted protein n=1 Tax=Candidatus Thiomargarita nelsonii TaxID=1003181 RepID=A0A0A6PB43_9GAMM|nr:hypothetical protein PN36_08900 [Candidatus Thiomargarita nelsonii]
MFKKNFFSFVCLTTIIFALTGASLAAPFNFPSKIKYDIFVDGAKKASSDFSRALKRDRSGTPVYQLSFGNFQALGFTSRDKIYTFVFKDSLSLSRTLLVRGKKKVYEMKAKKAQGMFGEGDTDVFVYKEETSAGSIQTEPYTPYKVIDLLSLFLVASESVASGNQKPQTQDFSFFVKKSTEVVQLKQLAKKTVPYQGRNVSTTVMELSHQDQEIFKLYIYKDNKGFYFPVQLSIEDDEQGLVELKATEAF